ncbi:MAG: hemerythrin family protein [Sulfurimonas sp.]|nr:hemerythrin family protein [Sulfurimonas sp.]MDQ7062447.1 hemerythrin family protein [Sulfurimonas sp.]
MMTQNDLAMLAIPALNDMHLEEILIINRLDKASRALEMDNTSAIMQELIDHTTLHFSTEDALMKEAGFPDYDTHKAEHDRHIHELKTWKKYFEKMKDPKAVWIHIEGNLEKWTQHHIQTMDTEMALFLEKSSSN